MQNLEEVEIARGDELHAEQIVLDEELPSLPVAAFRRVEQDERRDLGFAGLHQRQAFETFILRAEATRKKHEGVGLFHEIDLAREEVIEIDELLVAVDRFVGPLFEGQQNVQAESVVASRTLLRGTHDPVTTASDNHEPALDNLAPQFLRHFEFRSFRRKAGGSENGDLASVGVGLECF